MINNMKELENIKNAFDIFIKKSDMFIKKQKQKAINNKNNKKN